MFVKILGIHIFGIHDQGIGCNLKPGLKTAIYGTCHQQLSEAAPTLIGSAGQPSHAKAGYGIARQLLAIGLPQFLDIHLGRTQGVVTQDVVRRLIVDKHVDIRYTAPAMLVGVALQVRVELRHTAVKRGPLMHRRIERLLLKHAELCVAPDSALP